MLIKKKIEQRRLMLTDFTQGVNSICQQCLENNNEDNVCQQYRGGQLCCQKQWIGIKYDDNFDGL